MNFQDIEVIILAGGKGTRLQSVVNDVPKPMAPVNDQPFLSLLIKRLKKFGLSRFRLSVGYKREIIMDFFSDRYADSEINYTVEDSPLGTGGAIRKAIEESQADKFLVLNGDSFIDVNYQNLLEKISVNTICLMPVEDVSRYGQVEIQDGMVTQFNEKSEVSAPGLINSGVYYFDRKVLEYMPTEPFSIEKITLPNMAKANELNGEQVDGIFIDIGIPEDYHRSQELLKDFC